MFLVSTTWIDFQGFAFLVVLVALTLHLLCFVWFFAFVVSFFCFFTICKLQKYIDLLYFSKTKVNNIIANVDKGTL